MRKLYEDITQNFKANGENGKYATIIYDTDEITDIFGSLERFESIYQLNKHGSNNAESYKYPIITFEDSSAISGTVYDSSNDIEDIMFEAVQYFDKK